MRVVNATEVLLPGRGFRMKPDGTLVLSESSERRVEAAANYFSTHRRFFEALGGVIVCSGGYPGLSGGMEPIPEDRREGRQMRLGLEALGVPSEFLAEEIESDSTLENCLRTQEAGYFRNSRELAFTSQRSQAPRIRWLMSKVFKVPEDKIYLIEAEGEEDEANMSEEARLLRRMKLLYGLAKSPESLRRAERVARTLARATGMEPAGKYSDI